MANSRSATDTNDLVTAFNLARSEATRRRVPINVSAHRRMVLFAALAMTGVPVGLCFRQRQDRCCNRGRRAAGGAGVLTGNVYHCSVSSRPGP